MFWAVVIVAPIACGFVASGLFPEGSLVPLHWNMQGEVDRWGSPWEMVPLGFVMAFVNLMLAISYRFSDALYDHGLVHGVSRKATRPFLCGVAVFIVGVYAAVIVFWLSRALAMVG